MLNEVLARHTKMPVLAARQGLRLEENTVYVIQPATILEVSGLELRVSSRPTVDPSGPPTHIDVLFRSIARSFGERAGAVVLSGSGSDGAQGLQDILDAGGMGCAQSPETAKFDSMPLAAIARSSVRAVDAPEALAGIVLDGIRYPTPPRVDRETQGPDEALARILRAVVGATSVSASHYKDSTFERRVQRRMLELSVGSFPSYAEFVERDEAEAHRLRESLLIGVTRFFRDEEAFEVLAKQVVPELVRKSRADRRPIRVWVPGCATGEEAYTLAMLFMDATKNSPETLDLQIFATDLKRDFLTEAARGEYSGPKMECVPPSLREQFFESENVSGRWAVSSELRKSIVFAPHDILSDPPFTRLDLVSCRNLLIYFSIEAQHRVLSSFAFGLNAQGFLFLGPSESVGALRESFDIVDAQQRVFRRTGNSLGTKPFLFSAGRQERKTGGPTGSLRTPRLREAKLASAYSALLSTYAPPGLLIATDRELLHTFGEAREYTRPPEGVAHLDVAEMLDPNLKAPILAGMDRAIREKAPVTFTKLVLAEFPEPGRVVDVSLRPLAEPEGAIQQLLLLIEPQTDTGAASESSPTFVDASGLALERIVELEAELERTREALQSTIEEIETANEELQSSNEELMSSNEELQSTNEELSSVNEELYSVNAEYHRQNDELARLNGDFDLLLRTTEIGVVFLDGQLKITRFTGLASQMFGFKDADIKRSFGTFRSPFVDGEPLTLLEQSIETAAPVDAEFTEASGDRWLVRVVPHPNRAGVVLTLISIERLRAAEEDGRQKAEMLASLQALCGAVYWETDEQLHTVYRDLGLSEERSEGVARLSEAVLEGSPRDDFEEARGHALDGREFDLVAPVSSRPAGSQEPRIMRLRGVRGEVLDARGEKRAGWRVAGVDVHEPTIRLRESTQREALLESVLASSPAAMAYLDIEERYRYVNAAYERQWSVSRTTVEGQKAEAVLPGGTYRRFQPFIYDALNGERQEFDAEVPSPSGRARRLATTYAPVSDPAGTVTGLVSGAFDVSPYYARSQLVGRADRLLAQTTRHSPYRILVVDEATLLVEYANEAAMTSLGFRSDRALPRGVSISRLTTQLGDQAWRDWLASIPSGEDEGRLEVNVFDSQQRDVPADVYVTILEDEGRRMAIVRAFLNRERAAALQDLKERSRQLAISNRDLEQFAGVVAHDLRAPLRHVRFFAKALRENAHGIELPAEAREDLDGIEEGVVKMGKMIEALISYARIGRQTEAYSEVPLRAIIERAGVLFDNEVREHRAEIRIQVDEEVRVRGQETLLEQLFVNLIENALKYRRADQAPQIQVESRASDNAMVKVTFADNGIGIDPQFADRIFQLFDRLHSPKEYEGFGIGLTACRRICEIHGGTIDLDESHLSGACFVLRLPAAASADADASAGGGFGLKRAQDAPSPAQG